MGIRTGLSCFLVALNIRCTFVYISVHVFSCVCASETKFGLKWLSCFFRVVVFYVGKNPSGSSLFLEHRLHVVILTELCCGPSLSSCSVCREKIGMLQGSRTWTCAISRVRSDCESIFFSALIARLITDTQLSQNYVKRVEKCICTNLQMTGEGIYPIFVPILTFLTRF